MPPVACSGTRTRTSRSRSSNSNSQRRVEDYLDLRQLQVNKTRPVRVSLTARTRRTRGRLVAGCLETLPPSPQAGSLGTPTPPSCLQRVGSLVVPRSSRINQLWEGACLAMPARRTQRVPLLQAACSVTARHNLRLEEDYLETRRQIRQELPVAAYLETRRQTPAAHQVAAYSGALSRIPQEQQVVGSLALRRIHRRTRVVDCTGALPTPTPLQVRLTRRLRRVQLQYFSRNDSEPLHSVYHPFIV